MPAAARAPILLVRKLALKALRAETGAAPNREAEAKPESEPEPKPKAPLTVAEGWDAYASTREEVGDGWNRPRRIGVDVETREEVVPYLDRKVIAPFLGAPDTILEIGAGGGRFTEVLLPKCRRLIALDTSPNMLEILGRRFEGDGRLELQLGTGYGLDGVADESVDAVFSYGVFVHLQHWDIYNYLEETHRVLKPAGKALIQHSHTFSELGWKKFRSELTRQLNRHKIRNTFIVNTPELMREFAIRAGLEVVAMDTETAKRDCIALLRKP